MKHNNDHNVAKISSFLFSDLNISKMGAVSEKKNRNKKGTKIVAGKSLGITNHDDKQVNSSKAFQNGDYKIPRKPKNVAPSTNNSRGANDENKGPNANNGSWVNTKANAMMKMNSNNQIVHPKVLAKLDKNVDIGAVRVALNSVDKLPEKFKDAFGRASLELNDRRQFTVPKGVYIKDRLKMLLEKNHLNGWLEWLQGRRGWDIKTDKSPYVQYFRNLHEIYDIKARALMKEVNGDTKSVLRLLYYNENQQTLWKKASKTQSLHNAVGMIRPFLEVVKFFCTDPWEKWTKLPWLMPALTLNECKWRIEHITHIVKRLMRNSDWGPDSPVHWAAHPKRNSYPLTVVTSRMMTELVVGIANILGLLFLEGNFYVLKDLKDVDGLLASPLWTAQGEATVTMKAPSSNRNSKRPASCRNSKKKSAGFGSRKPKAVDDVIIDLTALSIND